jgi:hypothetical protein
MEKHYLTREGMRHYITNFIWDANVNKRMSVLLVFKAYSRLFRTIEKKQTPIKDKDDTQYPVF